MSPRPILKRSTPESAIHAARGVHFPPSPSALTRTFHVDSAHVYDRSPIVVTPNSCALPERGCPGHTYFDEPTTYSGSRRRGVATSSARPRDYHHPRAFASYEGVPQLIPDLSSESEESDGPIGISSSSSTSSTSSASSSASSSPSSGVMFGPHGLPANLASIKSTTSSMVMGIHTHGYAPVDVDEDSTNHALAFLPYSPSSPYPYADSDKSTGMQSRQEKPRRRRSSRERERRHESVSSTSSTGLRERDAYRIPGGEGCQLALAFSSMTVSTSSASSPITTSSHSSTGLYPSAPNVYSSASNAYPSSTPSIPSPKKRSSSSRKSRPSPPSTTGFGFGFTDDGCLGGF